MQPLPAWNEGILPSAAARRQMIRAPLQYRKKVVVVAAHNGGARQQRNVRAGWRSSATASSIHSSAPSPVAAQQAAAELALFVGDERARAGPGRLQRRRQAGGPRADHEHIAMPVETGRRCRDFAPSGASPRPAARRSSRSQVSHRPGGCMKIL